MDSKKLKVSILVEFKESPYGGGNQFLKALKKNFVKKGIYEEIPRNADVILINSYPFKEEYRFKQVFHFHRQNKLIIHRIDGPLHIYRGNKKDFRIDKIIYYFNRKFADGTIFQSNWSKLKNYELGYKSNNYETVILNASDLDIFNKHGKVNFNKNRKINLIASSISLNWRKGFKIYQYLDKNLDFSKYNMTFVGNSPISFTNIKSIRPLKSKDVVNLLKKHDIFITASQDDPCSNSLIEALQCGLPAIVLDSGGHPEIIGNAGVKFKNRKEIIEAIEEIVLYYEKYQRNINLPTIDDVATLYYNFIKKVYEHRKNNINSSKKNSYFYFLRIKFLIFLWKMKRFSFRYFFSNSLLLPIIYRIKYVLRVVINFLSLNKLHEWYIIENFYCWFRTLISKIN